MGPAACRKIAIDVIDRSIPLDHIILYDKSRVSQMAARMLIYTHRCNTTDGWDPLLTMLHRGKNREQCQMKIALQIICTVYSLIIILILNYKNTDIYSYI